MLRVFKVQEERIEGYLEVGHNENGEVVLQGDLKVDRHGVGHLHFSPRQARNLARLLTKRADWIDRQTAKGAKL